MDIYRLARESTDTDTTDIAWPVYDRLPSHRELLSAGVGPDPVVCQRPYGVAAVGTRWTVEMISMADGANPHVARAQAARPTYNVDQAIAYTNVFEWITGQTRAQVRSMTVLSGANEWPTQEFTQDGKCCVSTVTTNYAVTTFRIDPLGAVTFKRSMI